MKYLSILFLFSISFMPYDSAGKWCRITREHQMIPEFDTVLVTTYYRSNGRIYVRLKGGKDLWVDDCFEIDTTKR